MSKKSTAPAERPGHEAIIFPSATELAAHLEETGDELVVAFLLASGVQAVLRRGVPP